MWPPCFMHEKDVIKAERGRKDITLTASLRITYLEQREAVEMETEMAGASTLYDADMIFGYLSLSIQKAVITQFHTDDALLLYRSLSVYGDRGGGCEYTVR